MNTIKNTILSALLLLMFSACNDEYMERFPIETASIETAFETSANFRTYAWSFYSIFTNANIIRSFRDGANGSYYLGDIYANYIRNYKNTGIANRYADHRVNASTNEGYSFAFIRTVNTMLGQIDQSRMSEEEKNHWRSVGYFFRAYNYWELLMRFGDVPWIDHVLTEEEAMTAIPERSPRVEVAEKVLEELLYARDNINQGAFASLTVDGKNTINRNVVNALISRFALFEATWYRYHGMNGDVNKFLAASIAAAEELMIAYPSVDKDYDAGWNKEDGSAYVGMILYKEYATDLVMHKVNQVLRSTSMTLEATKKSVNMFLMQNGKPIHHPDNIGTFNDKNMYDEFRNRDYRLYLNIVPPYKCEGANKPTWSYTTGANATQEREYIDLMMTIQGEGQKRIPMTNWAGNTLNIIPHYYRKTNGGCGAPGFMVCTSGYYLWKDYNTWDKTKTGSPSIATADKQIFAIEEVLLNYAEAKYEKGEFSQEIADKTINKLRSRANVAKMNVSDIDDSFDPDRDPSVEPLLWEIRRERFVELFCQGFGFYDVRRWKTAPWWINQQPLGQYVRRSDQGGLPASMAIVNNASEGYLMLEPSTPVEAGKGWDDTFYLFPIPTEQLVLNPNLKQNPGWENF